MKTEPEGTEKRNGQNSVQKGATKEDRTYWVAVHIAFVFFAFQLLLCMYLLLGPGFWREFLK